MKCLGFVLLLGFISLGAIGGCNTNNGGDGSSQDARALTENDFVNDPDLFANPQEGVVALFLEHPDSEEPDNDTGNVGNDAIPYRYTQALNHTFCFTDDNDGSEHFMILQNTDGVEVMRALANGGCVTERIEAGDYNIILSHGGHVEEINPVFLIPIPEEEQVTKRYEFDQREFRTANGFPSKMHRYIPGGLVKFFEGISNVFTRPVRAQDFATELKNATTLINTNKCEGCDLMGLGFSGKDLSGAFLKGANLSKTDLTRTNLFQADLVDANLTSANLAGANLDGAGLGGAILTDAELSFAIWVTGFPCDVFSVGTCNTFNPNPTPCDSLTQSGDIIKCRLPSVETEVCVEVVCPPGILIPGGCEQCTMTDANELVISVDLVDVAQQASSLFLLTQDTPIAIVAWGGEGGEGSNSLFHGGG
jgi:hypothetical protein